MIEGPIGAAAFNNEFGRPNLAGYFRTFEQEVQGEVRGYHKPIMIAGGLGNIPPSSPRRSTFPPGTLLIQLGGPGMLIGLGGGAASSMATGTNTADLDFASVQRGNPEIQRRARKSSTAAGSWAKTTRSCRSTTSAPAACPTPCRNWPTAPAAARIRAARGAHRRAGHVAARDLVQRGAGALRAGHRARAPGRIPRPLRARALPVRRARHRHRRWPPDGEGRHFGNKPVDMDMEVLLGKPPKMTRDVARRRAPPAALRRRRLRPQGRRLRVLRLPAVASRAS
jgi:phosphoribosylformylglycinamidine synthase